VQDEISTKPVKWFRWNVEVSLYSFVAYHHTSDDSIIKLQENLSDGLKETWKPTFMTRCKPGCIVDEYNWKSVAWSKTV
jgi:hypothetical protein